MLNILKYLKKHGGMVVLILALLCVQAYCDLTLPKYTSDIVDVGIQQSGVERVAPQQMRGTTMEALTLFLSDEDEATLRAAYTAAEDGTYTLTVREKRLWTSWTGCWACPWWHSIRWSSRAWIRPC